MTGIELSYSYYLEYGKPMLESEFSNIMDRLAIGLVGHGSECFGYDDSLSKDHDFEPSFCIWLSEEDEQKYGFRLFRAYSKLPKEYMGIKCAEKSLLGNSCRGVKTISEFYSSYTGRKGAPQSDEDWLYTPSYYLAEATNGRVFYDGLGEFTRIREEIKNGMPEDVRAKKIASCAIYMAQTGQYNYSRCLLHGETAASRLALTDFAKNAAEMLYLLNKRHAPYYKWLFRGLKDIPNAKEIAAKIEKILLIPQEENKKIEQYIEDISSNIISELKKQNLSDSSSDFLENHAISVNNKIKRSQIRNLDMFL